MMQKSQSLKVTATSQLKKDKIESSKVVSSKQSIIVKQILDLVGQQNQDLYICLKDKKTGQIHQFSSNVPEFSLSKIATLVKAQKKKGKMNIRKLAKLQCDRSRRQVNKFELCSTLHRERSWERGRHLKEKKGVSSGRSFLF